MFLKYLNYIPYLPQRSKHDKVFGVLGCLGTKVDAAGSHRAKTSLAAGDAWNAFLFEAPEIYAPTSQWVTSNGSHQKMCIYIYIYIYVCNQHICQQNTRFTCTLLLPNLFSP